jgi:hydrogenase/urease accessory protein HupE
MKSLRSLSVKACCLASSAAFAHEGHSQHDGAWDGLLHWFTQGDHLTVLALGTLAVGFLLRKVIARSRGQGADAGRDTQ